MAKQWKHTFSKFYNGETDDTFIPTWDKYLSSYNIEPVLHPRYLELSERIVKTFAFTTTSDITIIVPIPNNKIYMSFSEIFLWTVNTTTITTLIGWSGYCNGGFLYNTSWALKVYIFDQTNMYRMNADLTTKEDTTAHAGWVVTAVTTASNTLVYAVWSQLYQVNNAGTISSALTTLPYGSVVKKLYYYNDLLYVFTQFWSDTVIYQCSFDWTVYNITYKHAKEDVKIYDMAWSSGTMYWVSNLWLYQCSGIDSQRIKNVLFYSNARCSFYKDDLLYIIEGLSVARYGTNIIWFPKAYVLLAENPFGASIAAIDWVTMIEVRIAWESDIITFWTRYPNTGEIVTMPYDAWVLWAEKNLNVIEFAYELKTGKTGASIQVQIQTNLMELNNTATYINIATLSTLSNSVMRCRIDKQEILTALVDENPDWQYARFKIILNWWDVDGSSYMRYSPKVYQDIMIAGNFINDAETYL